MIINHRCVCVCSWCWYRYIRTRTGCVPVATAVRFVDFRNTQQLKFHGTPTPLHLFTLAHSGIENNFRERTSLNVCVCSIVNTEYNTRLIGQRMASECVPIEEETHHCRRKILFHLSNMTVYMLQFVPWAHGSCAAHVHMFNVAPPPSLVHLAFDWRECAAITNIW